jgi:hypothetical protein
MGRVLRDAVRGGIAGAAATWLMDRATTVLLDAQPPEVTRREEAARPNGKSSVANLVDRVSGVLGVRIPERHRGLVESLVHYALGVVPGAVYGVLRRRIPVSRAGRGLGYGVLLFAANDEFVNTKLGLAAEPAAYPAQTHVRGLAGHAVLGVATESGIQLLRG